MGGNISQQAGRPHQLDITFNIVANVDEIVELLKKHLSGTANNISIRPITTLNIDNLCNLDQNLIGPFLRKLRELTTDSMKNVNTLWITYWSMDGNTMEDLTDCLRKHRSITKLTLACNRKTDTCINFLLDELVTNDTLKRVDLIVQMEEWLNHKSLCYVLTHNTVLEHLTLTLQTGFRWNLTNIGLLENALTQNNTLTHLSLCIEDYSIQEHLVDNIQFNTRLLSLNAYPVWNEPAMTYPQINWHYTTKAENLLRRNNALMWRNVHRELLNSTFVFNRLPAYIILEIFDWLPYMHLVSHYKKIQLILGVKKSIDKITWYGPDEDASSDWERDYVDTYVTEN